MTFKQKSFFLLYAMFCIALATGGVWHLYDSYLKAHSRLTSQLENESYLVAEWMRQSFAAQTHILSDIIAHIPLEDIQSPPASIAESHHQQHVLEQLRTAVPHAIMAGIIDQNCNATRISSADGIQLDAASYCQQIKNSSATRSLVMPLVLSPQKHPAIIQALKYDTPAPGYKGMAVLMLELDYFRHWTSSLRHNHGRTATIITTQGVVLACTQSMQCGVQRLNEPFLKDVIASNAPFTVVDQTSPADGVSQTFGIRKVEGLPFLIVVSETHALWQAGLHKQIFLTAIGIIVTMLLILLVMRQHMSLLQAHADLQDTSQEMETILEHSMVGIFRLDGSRIIRHANPRFAEIFGYATPKAAEGQSAADLHITPLDYEHFGEFYTTTLKNTGAVEIEYQFKKQDKTPIWARLVGRAIDRSCPANLDKGVIWIIDDITERKETEQRLIELATTDSLTGVYNRRHFMELGQRELAIHKRHARSMSILMLDIDHFKAVNDTYGHETGDKALTYFASLCLNTLRTADVFGRLGGEEFAIVLPDTGAEQARHIAERIRSRIEEFTPAPERNVPQFTVSIGIATTTGEQDLRTLLHNADSALYKAKANGRNRVEEFQAA